MAIFPPFDAESDDGKSRRHSLLRRGQVPIRVLVPSIFTLLGLCAGLTAIRMAIEHRWDLAVAALVFAAASVSFVPPVKTQHPAYPGMMPIYYMDNMDFSSGCFWKEGAGKPFSDTMIETALGDDGIYVFDFHPIHNYSQFLHG